MMCLRCALPRQSGSHICHELRISLGLKMISPDSILCAKLSPHQSFHKRWNKQVLWYPSVRYHGYTSLSQVNSCRLLRAQARAVAKEIENQEKEEWSAWPQLWSPQDFWRQFFHALGRITTAGITGRFPWKVSQISIPSMWILCLW